ncbi:type II secretion system protein [bacterium]|nr:type II secretion system protein [bacterium]MBQ9150059.1 type II secretion system protein [bacterium]
MRKRIAFTLAETLIVLCVLGVLATIMLSTLTGMTPDKSKIFYKKAYQLTERVVGELVNDEAMYPYDENRIGFRNTDAETWPGTNITYSGNTKFSQLFQRKLGTVETDTTCMTGTGFVAGRQFVTTDGICWNVPNIDFTNNNSAAIITVDINSEKEPNSFQDGDDRDRFRIFVNFDGRVHVDTTEFARIAGRTATAAAGATVNMDTEQGYLQTHEVTKSRNSENK